MTETHTPSGMVPTRDPGGAPPSEATTAPPPREYEVKEEGGLTGWAGWVIFAAVMMVLLGAFQVIEGLVAVFDDGYYLVGTNGLAVNVNYNAWGWLHFSIGVLAILAGLGLMTGNIVARILGVIIALGSAIINLGFIAAYPVWSTVVIAIDVIIIYAIVVHGRELKSY